jgi:hypothetical protein
MTTRTSSTGLPWLKASWQHWITASGPRPGPWWMQIVWSLMFAMLLALVFTVVGFAVAGGSSSRWLNLAAWGHWYGANLTVTVCVTFTIQALFALINPRFRDPRIARWKAWQSSLYHAGVAMSGVVIGWPLGVALVQGRARELFSWTASPTTMLGMFAFALLISLALHFWFDAKARQIVSERAAAEAQLRLLQGQIEPHFLFNTLANVAGLMDTDTARSRLMLQHFTDYLRGSLQGLRATEHRLSDELALVRAYLGVQAIRMEDRLSVAVDVPAELLHLAVPTLSLQPLVENAVLHGLEPALDGGEVRVQARAEAGVLRLQVLDSGVGLQARKATGSTAAGAPTRGNGHATQNLRERLARLHGPAASLSVEPRPGGGTQVVLTLPVRASTTSSPALA